MSAIEVKDRLYGMLNEVESDDEYMVAAVKVLEIIRLTLPMWIELEYAYKAAEIADRIADRLQDMENACEHHRRAAKIRAIASDARLVYWEARKAHNELMRA